MKEIHIPKHISSTFFEDKVIVLNQKINSYYSFNESAAKFWKKLTQCNSIDTSVKELSKFYNVPQEKIEMDLKKFVEHLSCEGIIEYKKSHF